MPLLCAVLCRWFVLCLFCLQTAQQLQNGIPCFLLDLLLALGTFRVDVFAVGKVETAVIVLGVISAVSSGSSVVSCQFQIDIPPFQLLGGRERSSEAAGSAAVLRQIIPSRI